MDTDDSFDVLYNALLIQDTDKRIQTLRTLIDSGVDVNSCWNKKCKSIEEFESEGLTVLMVAARYGYADCVQALLDGGAKVNQPDAEGRTALIYAANKGDGHDKCVRLLIKAGVDVNHSVEIWGTALIISAKFGYFKCMELLLEAGANVNSVDTRGNTALICCLNSYNYSKVKACLKLLIDAGADIDVRNNNLQPIHYALKWWKRTTFPVEYLISENCNLNQASYDLVEATIDKCYYSHYPLQAVHRLDMLKLLFVCGLPRHLCQSFTVEQDTSVRNWVETVASQPNTLKSICIFKIRSSLGLGIKSKVTKLNLPNVIQNLILLKGILSLECFN